jgi:predicted kinase
MQKLIICRGLPASGKSTWAKKYAADHSGVVIVNRDTLRLENPGRGEQFIRDLRDERINNALCAGFDVISDDTNLIPKTFDALVALATSNNVAYEVQDFTDISVEECIRRDVGRPNAVGEKVIRSFVKYIHMAKRQPIVSTTSNLPNAILCDLDGTLALFNGRGPFETEKCETDLLSIPVARVLEAVRSLYLQEGNTLSIILMSGREDKFRPHTERWLAKNNIFYDELYMRKTKDMRADQIVKRELFDAHVANKYNVLFVLDDRDKVVRMWRHDLNLTVFQVAEGNF